jgi:hypothetical protein
MASPNEIFLPNGFSMSSEAELKQRIPISNTTKAIKKVWTVMICLLIKLNELSSLFHLKYFGKMM